MTSPTTVHVIGTAQDGGVPQMGAVPWNREHRLVASLAVVDGSGRALLIDATPDLRHQQRKLLGVPEYAGRTGPAPFDGVALTHGHMGHYTGLVHFGRESANTAAVPCWVTPAMARYLGSNDPWRRIVADGNLRLLPVEPGTEFTPWPGLRVAAVAVPHRAEHTDTVGYSLRSDASGRGLLYVPDIDGWDRWPEAETVVAAHDIAVVDATFYAPDELRGQREVPHPPVVDTVARFRDLVAGGRHRIVLTHLNHTNPLCDPTSDEARMVAGLGFEIAAEMQRIDL